MLSIPIHCSLLTGLEINSGTQWSANNFGTIHQIKTNFLLNIAQYVRYTVAKFHQFWLVNERAARFHSNQEKCQNATAHFWKLWMGVALCPRGFIFNIACLPSLKISSFHFKVQTRHCYILVCQKWVFSLCSKP